MSRRVVLPPILERELQDVLAGVARMAVDEARGALAKSVLVGPFDDRGVAEPGKERGPGFAMFIGEWRIGWWATRAEACEVARRLGDAIQQHPIGGFK